MSTAVPRGGVYSLLQKMGRLHLTVPTSVRVGLPSAMMAGGGDVVVADPREDFKPFFEEFQTLESRLIQEVAVYPTNDRQLKKTIAKYLKTFPEVSAGSESEGYIAAIQTGKASWECTIASGGDTKVTERVFTLLSQKFEEVHTTASQLISMEEPTVLDHQMLSASILTLTQISSYFEKLKKEPTALGERKETLDAKRQLEDLLGAQGAFNERCTFAEKKRAIQARKYDRNEHFAVIRERVEEYLVFEKEKVEEKTREAYSEIYGKFQDILHSIKHHQTGVDHICSAEITFLDEQMAGKEVEKELEKDKFLADIEETIEPLSQRIDILVAPEDLCRDCLEIHEKYLKNMEEEAQNPLGLKQEMHADLVSLELLKWTFVFDEAGKQREALEKAAAEEVDWEHAERESLTPSLIEVGDGWEEVVWPGEGEPGGEGGE